MIHDKLFKQDTTGRLRFWQLESNGAEYRTICGLYPDGSAVVSGWTKCTGKQGRTDVEQCAFEVQSKYKHQLDREYHLTPETTGTPNFFEPMLAKTYDGFEEPGYIQPKLDGIRCIARAEGLFSRQGQEIVAVPHIYAALEPLFEEDPDLILDGELYNHEFREDFGAISSIVRKKNPTAAALEKAKALMEYHVYDAPSYDGPFADRNNFYRTLLIGLNANCVVPVETIFAETAETADEYHGLVTEAGYEGSMFRLNKPYEQKRSKTLLKRKEFITEEFQIVSIEEGNGNWAGAAKRMTLRLKDGRQFGAGIRGTYTQGEKLLMAQSWGKVTDRSVATLRYFMLSPDGVPRFPVVIDYHLDGRQD